jgi:hypothetical protein
MKSVYVILLTAVLQGSSFGQTTTGKARTSGVCSPATSGNNNTFVIKCGIGSTQGKQMIEILNKVLANQIDPTTVMTKLDEILKATSRPAQIVNAPNGIGGIGGTYVNPQVNNFGYMQKTLNADQMTAISALMRPFADGTDRGNLITCQLGDSNSCTVAMQLVKIFRNAGWILPGSGYSQAVMTEAPEPLLISVHAKPTLAGEKVTSSAGLPPGAYELANALNAVGMNVQFSIDASLSTTEFRIIVGTHP